MARRMYTKRLGEFVAANANGLLNPKYHVSPLLKGKWAVVKHGSLRATRIFTNEADAVSFAILIATAKSVPVVVVHTPDRKIKERISIPVS